MKLLIPTSTNRVYHLAEKQLMNLFAPIFGASLGKMLAHLEQGDASETLKRFFEKSGQSRKRSRVTLKQVDDFLDELTKVTKRDDQSRVLSNFVENLTGGLGPIMCIFTIFGNRGPKMGN